MPMNIWQPEELMKRKECMQARDLITLTIRGEQSINDTTRPNYDAYMFNEDGRTWGEKASALVKSLPCKQDYFIVGASLSLSAIMYRGAGRGNLNGFLLKTSLAPDETNQPALPAEYAYLARTAFLSTALKLGGDGTLNGYCPSAHQQTEKFFYPYGIYLSAGEYVYFLYTGDTDSGTNPVFANWCATLYLQPVYV